MAYTYRAYIFTFILKHPQYYHTVANAQAAWHTGKAESGYKHQAGQSNQSRALATVLATEGKARWDQLCVNLHRV